MHPGSGEGDRSRVLPQSFLRDGTCAKGDKSQSDLETKAVIEECWKSLKCPFKVCHEYVGGSEGVKETSAGQSKQFSWKSPKSGR